MAIYPESDQSFQRPILQDNFWISTEETCQISGSEKNWSSIAWKHVIPYRQPFYTPARLPTMAWECMQEVVAGAACDSKPRDLACNCADWISSTSHCNSGCHSICQCPLQRYAADLWHQALWNLIPWLVGVSDIFYIFPRRQGRRGARQGGRVGYILNRGGGIPKEEVCGEPGTVAGRMSVALGAEIPADSRLRGIRYRCITRKHRSLGLRSRRPGTESE